jgi:hypothetical protein
MPGFFSDGWTNIPMWDKQRTIDTLIKKNIDKNFGCGFNGRRSSNSSLISTDSGSRTGKSCDLVWQAQPTGKAFV